MTLFIDVLTTVTLPIVALMGFGYVGRRKLGFDVATLNRLLVYACLPSLFVTRLSSADLPLAEVQASVAVTLVQFAVMLVIGLVLAKLCRVPGALIGLLALGVAFPNSGNFGIPLVELAFGPKMVVHQAVITMLHVVLVLLAAPIVLGSSDGTGPLRRLGDAFKTPMIPAVALGLALNALGWTLPAPLARPLELMSMATSPVALTALGVQLAVGGFGLSRGMVGLGVTLKLIVAPVLTWAALVLLPIELPRELFELYVVGAAVPIGVLLAILAHEAGRHAPTASALVALTTLLSPISVTLAIFLVRL